MGVLSLFVLRVWLCGSVPLCLCGFVPLWFSGFVALWHQYTSRVHHDNDKCDWYLKVIRSSLDDILMYPAEHFMASAMLGRKFGPQLDDLLVCVPTPS